MPILGDIPLIGYLFRYETRRRVKTNLMLFLRPYVIRHADDSRAVTITRYEMMRSFQKDIMDEPSFALPTFEGPMLPENHLGKEPAAMPSDTYQSGPPQPAQ